MGKDVVKVIIGPNLAKHISPQQLTDSLKYVSQLSKEQLEEIKRSVKMIPLGRSQR